MTIFFPAKLFFEPNEPINYYVLAILSGLTGSVWGVIINELARDWRTESLISDIYKDKNQSKRYMKKMIIIGIITLIYIFLLSFFIDYFKVG